MIGFLFFFVSHDGHERYFLLGFLISLGTNGVLTRFQGVNFGFFSFLFLFLYIFFFSVTRIIWRFVVSTGSISFHFI